MKTFIKFAIVVAALAAPALSFAQSNEPVTRAEVRAQLAQLEKAGYNPNDWMNYPTSLQRAEVIVAQQNSNAATYGGATNGTSQAGK
ncbi:uncharacterized protein DUF4148 [Paraburkholderia eburnea]|uniref:Uncharacterized protein DUF4148 n=1 Tax=Paraburkholderia eburnea TaxID=1189126 RepID=A0A2S4M633_9BURK|nr:DUF4148 domain-containing protein [Paraburkholderia eburnea]POR50173.1 uncharacterized protein DUF4148 [Paraburkholderia eburnea]PRZ20546.1 uncharacterized protein DUF4148 [Paraburkholderia eburnea]